jgi:pyrimidine operon attenuation protein/uracil phosphoribosyltransferase
MPTGGQQVFIPDRRGNRLERHLFEVAADRRSHRLFLRASAEIVSQFIASSHYRLVDCSALAMSEWTHCLEGPGVPSTSVRELVGLLSEVITLPSMQFVDFSIAMDWYKIPAEGVDSRNWRNTPDGQRVHVGKYWKSSPEAMKEAGRALVRRLVEVIRRHPTLASVEVVAAVPGHDSTYVSFGERVADSVSRALARPLIKVTSPHEFRPPAKNLPPVGYAAAWDEFSVAEDLRGATALIVDDVFHTGRTMSAVGSALRRAGAAQACGLAAVRTVRR